MKRDNKLMQIFVVLTLVIPFLFSLTSIITGSIPFWYDPARDLLLGIENLEKISLIGPPSGIPGIFYGPYWIWFLSLGLLISLDPRVVSFLVLTVPYFVLFPFIWYQFGKLFQTKRYPVMWLLFFVSFGSYTTALWNPHLNPLFTLLSVLFLMHSQQNKQQFLYALYSGIAAGIALQFHIAFGIGFVAGVIIYLLLSITIPSFQNHQYHRGLLWRIGSIGGFLGGLLISGIPFFFFEIRHGFQQTQTFLTALTKQGAVVTLTGLSDVQVLEHFTARLTQLLGISSIFSFILFLGLTGYLLHIWKKQKPTFAERHLALLLIVVSSIILFVYLISKNPIWSYHFITVEILFLLFLFLIVQRSKSFFLIFLAWGGVLLLIYSVSLFQTLQKGLETQPVFATKKHIAEKIITDANNKDYAVASYDPALYAYDYEYLFFWLANKKIAKTPQDIDANADTVYLIIPKTSASTKTDFIQYFTTPQEYNTVNMWESPDGTTTLKRMKSK